VMPQYLNAKLDSIWKETFVPLVLLLPALVKEIVLLLKDSSQDLQAVLNVIKML
jgi:hypothetical protein